MSRNQGRALSVISMINMLSFPGTDMSLDSGREDCMFWPFMYGDPPAIVVSDFNFVGNASALIKKGAKQSFIDINAFRDIFIGAFKPIKEDQADIDPGESSKCMYI